jgi:hypothetical protein
MNKNIDFRKVFLSTGYLSFMILYSFLWVRMINSQAERTGTDFIGFYTAGRIVQIYGSQSIYIPEIQQKIEESVVGFKLVPGQILLFNHLPYLVPLLSLVVSQNFIPSFIRWTFIILIFYLLDIGLLFSTINNSGLKKQESVVLAIGTFLFFPFFVSLMNGQDTVFLLLGAVILVNGLNSNKPLFAGLGLSLMTIRPQLAIIIALPFLFYNRKVFYWFLIGSISLGIFILAFLGLEGLHHLIEILLTSSQGGWYGLHPEDMPTLTGLLHRNFLNLQSNIILIIGLAGYLISLVSLSLIWFKSNMGLISKIGTTFLVSIFFVPYLHYHDLTLLLVPLVCIMQLYLPEKKGIIIHSPLYISFLLIFGYFWPPIKFPTVFITMVVMLILLLIPYRNLFLNRSLSSKT